jgi:serine/threonine-protein kinase
MVKGKAAYMSPEQCRSIAVDRRSDVFCLGIMLYELLAAQRPFNADNALALLGQIVGVDPEPPSRLRPGIPRGLDQIVLRALAKDPAARFESAFAMQEALEMFTREHRLHALPGALGRYLEHLFGPKPYPWLPRERTTMIPPPPVPPVSHSFVTTPRQRIDEGLPTEIPEADATLLPPEPTTTQTRTEPQRPSEIAIAPVAALGDTTSVRPRRWGRWTALAGGIAGVAVWASFAASGPPAEREAATAPAEVAPPPPPQPDTTTVVASPASAAVAPALAPTTPIAAPTDDGATIVDDLDPTPAITSADRPTDDRKARRQQAQRWIERAQAVVYQDPKQAAAYAEQAIATMPMQAGYSVLGVAACRSGNRSAAQRAFDHLRGNRRTDLAAVCESRGLTLE